jgi:hypothetical protein
MLRRVAKKPSVGDQSNLTGLKNEVDTEGPFFCHIIQFRLIQFRRPAWENDRRLKINDNGVYGGKSRCIEISNFRHSSCKSHLN